MASMEGQPSKPAENVEGRFERDLEKAKEELRHTIESARKEAEFFEKQFDEFAEYNARHPEFMEGRPGQAASGEDQHAINLEFAKNELRKHIDACRRHADNLEQNFDEYAIKDARIAPALEELDKVAKRPMWRALLGF